MKVAVFRHIDAFEQTFCLSLNRRCAHRAVQRTFAIVSRLGNGVFWYTLMALLPLVYGERGVLPALRMVVAGTAGVLVYKALKSTLVRERPYISYSAIVAGTAPLDRYSFPSGHTLHAVNFTVLASTSFPELAWVLVPFAVLVAASRIVLGLHYPTDVAAGALLGGCIAQASLELIPESLATLV